MTRRPRTGSAALALLLLALLQAPGTFAAEAPPASAAARLHTNLGEGKTLWDIFLDGGWCMWPILGSSVVGMAFYLERVIELRHKRHVPPGFDKDIVHVVDTRGVDAGLALCLEKQSSLSRVLYAALLRYGTSRQEMETAVRDEGTRLLYDLRRNSRVIGLMCLQAPLWGLLGTVLGLIDAFGQAAAAGAAGTTDQFAESLSVALVAAAFGLLVLIPLTALYFHAKGKIGRAHV